MYRYFLFCANILSLSHFLVCHILLLLSFVRRSRLRPLCSVRSINWSFCFSQKCRLFLKQVLKIIHFIVSGCRKCTLLLSHHPADLPTYPPMQHWSTSLLVPIVVSLSDQSLCSKEDNYSLATCRKLTNTMKQVYKEGLPLALKSSLGIVVLLC